MEKWYIFCSDSSINIMSLYILKKFFHSINHRYIDNIIGVFMFGIEDLVLQF